MSIFTNNTTATPTLQFHVGILSGRNLAAKDKGGTSDPFLILHLLDAAGLDLHLPQHQTHVVDRTLAPEWNEEVVFDVDVEHPPVAMRVECWDKDLFGKQFMGKVVIPLNEALFPGQNISVTKQIEGGLASIEEKKTSSGISWLKSMIPKGKSGKAAALVNEEPRWYTLEKDFKYDEDVTGEIQLSMGWMLPTGTDLMQQWKSTCWLYVAAVSDVEHAEAIFGPDAPVLSASVTTSAPKPASVDIQSNASTTLTTNGATDLLLGVVFLDVTSASHLPRYHNKFGTSFDMDPFVVVTVGRRTFRTRIIRHTTDPTWNERVLFSVRQSEVSNTIKFALYDNDIVGKNTKIGEVEMRVSDTMEEATKRPADKEIKMMTAEEANKKDMKEMTLPLTLSSGETRKNHEAQAPELKVRIGFVSTQQLRRRFWITLAQQYDADGNKKMNVHEVQTMLDSLESTVSDETVYGWFRQYKKDPEAGECLSFDQFAECLEAFTMDPVRAKELFQRAETIRAKKRLLGSRWWFRNSNDDQDIVAKPSIEEINEDDDDLTLEEEGLPVEELIRIRKCPVCHASMRKFRSMEENVTHFAICTRENPEKVSRILMADFVTEEYAQRKMFARLLQYVTWGGYKVGKNNANILVLDRSTGAIVEEKMPTYIRMGIRLLYKSIASKSAINTRAIKKVLKNLTVKQGQKYDSPESVKDIEPFINFHKLKVEEILDPMDSFQNFNQFFYRKLKPGARPIDSPQDPNVLVSVADARCMFFPTISLAQEIWIKGRNFSVSRLLGSDTLAKLYDGGSLAIFRLAPQDYHRFHVPADGKFTKPKKIEGDYYTVNPMAIRSALDVYGENSRVVSMLESERFGTIAYVSIGAMMVGSIVLTSKPGQRVIRGDEHGYFAFGGSTIVLLFQKGVVEFDSDLIKNSSESLETLLKMGNSFGRANGAQQTPAVTMMEKFTAFFE